MKIISKPGFNENAFYYDQFINNIEGSNSILKLLKENAKHLELLILSLSEKQLTTSYSEGKWCIKDIIIHLVDFERVMIYRAMRFARNDKSPQPFFDENEYAKQACASKMKLNKILKEYKMMRQTTLAFFNNQTAITLKRVGVASNCNMSVRACAWIICGHEQHHINIIKERYLKENIEK